MQRPEGKRQEGNNDKRNDVIDPWPDSYSVCTSLKILRWLVQRTAVMVDDPFYVKLPRKNFGDAVHSECRLVYALVCWLLLEEAADSAACTPNGLWLRYRQL